MEMSNFVANLNKPNQDQDPDQDPDPDTGRQNGPKAKKCIFSKRMLLQDELFRCFRRNMFPGFDQVFLHF